MSSTRSSTNPPKYYYTLDDKAQKNWMKTTKKMEQNETLKLTYPPFQTTSKIKLIHVHYLTSLDTINELIDKAKTTTRYSIDTESAKTTSEGALVQIQMIHSKIESTIVLLEVNYLPDHNTLLYERIKQFCASLFNYDNEIITWGFIEDELKNFQHLRLFDIGKIIFRTNLQSEFRNYHNIKTTHPARESREVTGASHDTPGESSAIDYEIPVYYSNCDCGHHTHADPNGKWKLQDAVKTEFHQFIDKSFTVNHWECGLDLQLNTWKQKLFSRRHYDAQIEKNQRLNMIKYAQDDCTTVTELYFKLYPNGKNKKINHMYETPRSITIINHQTQFYDEISDISDDEIPVIAVKPQSFEQLNENITLAGKALERLNEGGILTTEANNEDVLSYISESELIEMLKPKFDKQPQQHAEQPNPVIPGQFNQAHASTSSSTTREAYRILTPEEEQQRKQQKQQRKNEKLKLKQKYHPEFQRKITRPIYYRYEPRKIRAQLADDNIHTSHQLAINRERVEVVIGFKTQEEFDRATKIMKINYFSKESIYKQMVEGLKEEKVNIKK